MDPTPFLVQDRENGTWHETVALSEDEITYICFLITRDKKSNSPWHQNLYKKLDECFKHLANSRETINFKGLG